MRNAETLVTMVFFIMAGAATASALVLHVSADGSGEYPTIQAALYAAAPHDTIELADGEYAGPGNRDLDFGFFIGTMRSASGDPTLTVLALEGHPIGAAEFMHGPDLTGIGFVGGQRLALQYTQVEIRDCRFVDCDRAFSNSGWIDWHGEANFYDCEFVDCTDQVVACGNLTMERCRFVGGEGMAVYGWFTTLIDCEFEGNRAPQELVQINGADTIFGGGYLEGCRFFGNEAEPVINAHYNMLVELIGCSFARNSGSILHAWEIELLVANCSFAGNGRDGGADLDLEYSFLDVQRCIFAHGAGGEVLSGNQIELDVSCTDVFGNAGGDWTGLLAPFAGQAGNFSANPAFCNWGAGDLTLYDISPCLPGNHPDGVNCGLVGAEDQGCENPTGAPGEALAVTLRLAAHPNPFNPKTHLVFDLPRAGSAELAVYDPAGRRRRSLLAGEELPAGRAELSWDGRDDAGRSLPSGVYFARLVAGAASAEAKLILLR